MILGEFERTTVTDHVQTLEPQESAVEAVKRSSQLLRGDLAAQLENEEPNVSSNGEQLLKFHGIYAQDNRDVRRERARVGEPLDFMFMIRVAIPGGHLNAAQWLALDRVAEEIGDGSLRLTTRQAVQFHGVHKGDLRPLAATLHAHLMTSFAACGDVVRNIVTCPMLQTDSETNGFAAITARLAATLKPRSNAHWEIFVKGDRVASYEPEEEHSFYGGTYLPRKFKIGIAHPNDNCIDVFAQDVGLIPGQHPEVGEGFNVVVGGGLGRSYANPDTFAKLAEPLTFASLDEIDELLHAIIETYRDLGNRVDRRRARMKYLVADMGIAVFRKEVENRIGRELRESIPVSKDIAADDHLGWRLLDDGTYQLGVRVGAGRVRDVDENARLRTALRIIAESFPVHFFITAQQDLIISQIATGDRDTITSLLDDHGVVAAQNLGPIERTALACPALPTCGQALAESERRLPELVDLLEGAMREQGIGDRPLQLRMTGCPNGCARPAVAEIGVVGRTKSTYDVYAGGGVRGDRLASLVSEKVRLEDIPDVLAPLLERWKSEGDEQERFGDFYDRVFRS